MSQIGALIIPPRSESSTIEKKNHVRARPTDSATRTIRYAILISDLKSMISLDSKFFNSVAKARLEKLDLLRKHE